MGIHNGSKRKGLSYREKNYLLHGFALEGDHTQLTAAMPVTQLEEEALGFPDHYRELADVEPESANELQELNFG